MKKAEKAEIINEKENEPAKEDKVQKIIEKAKENGKITYGELARRNRQSI